MLMLQQNQRHSLRSIALGCIMVIGLTTAGNPTRAAGPVGASPSVIHDDMALRNDQPLLGAPTGPQWATGPGFVSMGGDTRGQAAPEYWKPANPAYRGAKHWNAVIPWVVVFPGVRNTATRTWVEMRNLSIYLESEKRGGWYRLANDKNIEGANYPASIRGENVTDADLNHADTSSRFQPENGAAFHGWWSHGKLAIQGSDVRNVFVSVEARLVFEDPWFGEPDTMQNAHYLMAVGADYWPSVATDLKDFAPADYNPGAGGSRFKRIKPQWQTFNFTSVPLDKINAIFPLRLSSR
jgi:hypothetical protein